jgi:hypothetical protein
MSPLIAIFEVYLPTEQNNLAVLFRVQFQGRIQDFKLWGGGRNQKN